MILEPQLSFPKENWIEYAKELRKEIARLQDIIDKPPEEDDFLEDSKLLESVLNPLAQKWLIAFRKAQNSNLVRAQQNERFREEIARWQKIATKAAATAGKAIETTDVDWHKMVSEEDIQEAARELGIATSDHIREPTKMMLTAEQRAALKAACQIFQSAIDGESGKPLSERVMLLVGINSTIGAMLNQSRPGWEITEERRIALGSVRMLLDALALKPTGSWGKERAVLRGMLEECK